MKKISEFNNSGYCFVEVFVGFCRFEVKNMELFFLSSSLIIITVNARNYLDTFFGPYHPSLNVHIKRL